MSESFEFFFTFPMNSNILTPSFASITVFFAFSSIVRTSVLKGDYMPSNGCSMASARKLHHPIQQFNCSFRECNFNGNESDIIVLER
jgi:hypothetical protein